MPALGRRSNGKSVRRERERPCRERCGGYARVEKDDRRALARTPLCGVERARYRKVRYRKRRSRKTRFRNSRFDGFAFERCAQRTMAFGMRSLLGVAISQEKFSDFACISANAASSAGRTVESDFFSFLRRTVACANARWIEKTNRWRPIHRSRASSPCASSAAMRASNASMRSISACSASARGSWASSRSSRAALRSGIAGSPHSKCA